MARLSVLLTVTVALMLSTACGKKTGDAGAKEGTPSTGSTGEGSDPVPEPAAKVSPAERLLTYLEPEATGVLYIDLGDHHLDPELLATVFALPPRGRALLTAADNVNVGLEAVLGPDAPSPEDLLEPQALVMTPAVATGVYVLRPLKKTAAEVEAILTESAMQKTELEGTTLLNSTGAFPFKAAFLGDDVIAFIPRGEIGSGMGPLTAGRDLPPSEIRQELSQLLQSDTSVALVGVVAGPMLHLELSDDVALARLILRRWQQQGLDAEIRMQTTGEPASAAKELEERTAALETDQVQALIDRVAFTVDGPTVAGRLQLTPEDLAQLRKSK